MNRRDAFSVGVLLLLLAGGLAQTNSTIDPAHPQTPTVRMTVRMNPAIPATISTFLICVPVFIVHHTCLATMADRRGRGKADRAC